VRLLSQASSTNLPQIKYFSNIHWPFREPRSQKPDTPPSQKNRKASPDKAEPNQEQVLIVQDDAWVGLADPCEALARCELRLDGHCRVLIANRPRLVCRDEPLAR
jgi:hypothetical protein